MAIAQMWRDDMMMDEKTKDSTLIGSDRVEGTAVYGRDGDKIGTVQRVLLEKRSGQARDVEISVGSFLGMGGELHSLPWQKFDYDTDLGGYKLNVTEDELRDAPTYKEADRDSAYDREYQTEVYRYWTVSPYW
jgi:sporulation protein YlmC with PRC-barrel domain